MQRILVLGCSGSGKTTFSRALAGKLNLPFVSLDQLYWQPGWREPVEAEFTTRVVEAASGPAWVMDGNFTRQGGWELRRERADTVVLFDLPRWKCLLGAFHRIATTYGTVRPEMAPGCPERIDPTFLRYVWNFRGTHRPALLAKLAGLRSDQPLHTFRTRAEAGAFLAAVAAA